MSLLQIIKSFFTSNKEQPMSNVLVISGHPNLQQSTANSTILAELSTLLPNAEVRKLSELYPDFNINVEAEQEALLKADVIVWQFPINWYHFPAIMQKWLSDVFTYGFAYGSEQKLAGKKLYISCTTATPEEAYQHGGAQAHTIEEYSYAYQQTAAVCGLEFAGIIHSGGMLYIPGMSSEEDKQNVIAKAKQHAERVVSAVK